MTEQEVQEIFVKQLTDKNTPTALIESYYQIILLTLEKLAKPWADRRQWGLLIDNAYVKSRLCVFTSIQEGASFKLPFNLVDDLVFVYRHFLRILFYLHSEYKNINCPRFKSLYSLESLLLLTGVLQEKYAKIKSSADQSRQIVFNPVELKELDQLTNVLFLTVLGEAMIEEFITEVNDAFKVLRKYKKELSLS